MDKRYQVFVSSTYRDLREERQEVMQALLELDCIPSGMELFPAADEDQWSLIKRVIEECDYYVLILAGRYGSLGPAGISYTEMEYRYALDIGKPTVAFLHENIGSLAADRCEESPDGRQKLREFREFAEKKVCRYWTNAGDLGSVVSRSLIKLIKNRPAVGWVRSDALPGQDVILEVVRLRRRVDELERELQLTSTSPPKGSEHLAQGEETFTIHYTFQIPGAPPGTSLSSEFTPTWNDIFSFLAPLMMPEASEITLQDAMDGFVRIRNVDRLRGEGVNPYNFRIEFSDFQKIKLQLRALGLITVSERPRDITDAQAYWKLTPYGDYQAITSCAIPKSREENKP
jgi:hypothetical protein